VRESRTFLLLYKEILEAEGTIKTKRRPRVFSGLHMQSLIGSTGLHGVSAQYHCDRTFDAMCRYVKVGLAESLPDVMRHGNHRQLHTCAHLIL
jgi:hypothetical protein